MDLQTEGGLIMDKPNLTSRLKHAWNAFRNRDPTMFYREPGASYTYRPDRVRFSRGNEKSIVTSVYNRIAMDVSACKIEHVKYAQEDLILVAPATANTISKFAHKIADDAISTLLITAYGHDTPIIFVPSMHDSMFKAIESNVEDLNDKFLSIIKENKINRLSIGVQTFNDKYIKYCNRR